MEKPTRYYSNKSEKAGAKRLGMKQQSNSGATKFNKGDLIDTYTLVEDKTLTKKQKSHSIKKAWLDKNKEETFAMGRQFSALRFDFGDRNNYIILSENDFIEMYEAWKELYGNE